MAAEAVSKAVPIPMEGHRIRVPSAFQCGLMIFAIKVALKTLGFGWTIQWIRRRLEEVPATAVVDLEVVKATEHAVAMAGALYPGRALCLEQSLALYYLLRHRGMCVRFRIGVQPHPFEAHAWVEYNGEVINDVAEHLKAFVPLPDELP